MHTLLLIEASVGIERCLPWLPAPLPLICKGVSALVLQRFKRQATFGTTRQLPSLTRRTHGAYSVFEETVEGFAED
jgi:hypothetical protein